MSNVFCAICGVPFEINVDIFDDPILQEGIAWIEDCVALQFQADTCVLRNVVGSLGDGSIVKCSGDEDDRVALFSSRYAPGSGHGLEDQL